MELFNQRPLQNVCLQTYKNNRIRKKVAYYLRKTKALP